MDAAYYFPVLGRHREPDEDSDKQPERTDQFTARADRRTIRTFLATSWPATMEKLSISVTLVTFVT